MAYCATTVQLWVKHWDYLLAPGGPKGVPSRHVNVCFTNCIPANVLPHRHTWGELSISLCTSCSVVPENRPSVFAMGTLSRLRMSDAVDRSCCRCDGWSVVWATSVGSHLCFQHVYLVKLAYTSEENILSALRLTTFHWARSRFNDTFAFDFVCSHMLQVA